jgi:hypothetical protein
MSAEAVERLAARFDDMCGLGTGDYKDAAVTLRALAADVARLRANITACLDGAGQFAVRVCEGGGPEDIEMSLAVTMDKMKRAALAGDTP